MVYRMTDYEEIDKRHFSRLSELIDYFQDAGVEVILYLPPYSPMMYNYIESEEAFRITLEVEEKVKALAAEKGLSLYGSYDPAGCGCSSIACLVIASTSAGFTSRNSR